MARERLERSNGPEGDDASWSEVATTRAPRPMSSSLVWAAIVWAAAFVPVWIQLRRLDYLELRPRDAIAVTVVAVLLSRRWPRWSPVVAALAAMTIHFVDRGLRPLPIVILVLLPLVMAAAAGVVVPRRASFPSVPLLVAWIPLLIIEAMLGWGTGLRNPAALLVVSALLVATSIVWPRPIPSRLATAGGRMGTLARRVGARQKRLLGVIGRPLGALVGAIVMVPAALTTCCVWIAQRIARVDPLDPPTARSTRWVVRGAADVSPVRSFADLRVEDRRGAAQLGQRLIASLLAFALLGGPTAYVVWRVVRKPEPVPQYGPPAQAAPASKSTKKLPLKNPCTDTPDSSVGSPALDGQAGWPSIGCYATQFADHGVFDATTTYTYRDIASHWVNETNGVRTTWTPPPCKCRRVKVWWFGGSAAWGWYQRDEFSPPSQLAKAAWAKGIALDISNFAMPGWVRGQSVRKFGELLSMQPPPDIAMFYDGANDLTQQNARNSVGRGSDESEAVFIEQPLNDLVVNGPVISSIASASPPPTTGPPVGPQELAAHAMVRYGHSVELARHLAESVAVTPIFLWQPMLASSPAATGSSKAIDDDSRKMWAAIIKAALSHLPAGEIDLSHALDGVTKTVFHDLIHTNELAADVIAQAIFARVQPQLKAAAAAPPRAGK